MADGGMILSGICQKAGTLNQNGRKYSKGILEREVERYQELIRQNRATGELDHPDSSIISLEKVSHMVIALWMEGNDVYGKIKVLNTPAGMTLRALIDGGVQVGISSRGLGSVYQRNGETIVDDDFQLICFDMVSEPSTPGAFMMREQKDSLYENKDEKLNRLFGEILED